MKEYKRQCPKCGEELHYKYRQSYWKACKTNNWCGSCRKLEVNSRPEYQNKLKIINDSFKEKFKGKNNPFFGKKHTNRSISLIKANTSVKYGDKNPCYKKSVYYWWEKKYGKEAADTKLLNFKKILSNKMSGEKNPMYGKPSPPGAGNGWSGWYKGWYFRSIYELSYMIKVIERFNLIWETGESKKYRIKWTDYKNIERNYFCDFVVNGKFLVECKPKKLHNTPTVSFKMKGALNFCKNNSLKYKLVSPQRLTDEEILNLYNSKKIKFTDKYEQMFREKYNHKKC